MYVSPFLSKAQSQTPKEYTNRARDEITRKLNLSNQSTLKHGPSPLQRVTSTSSDSSLTRTASNDSMETITEHNNQPHLQEPTTKKVKNIFGSLGKLRRRTSGSSMNSPSQESILRHEQSMVVDEDTMMVDDDAHEDAVSISSSAMNQDIPALNQMQALHPVPSIDSVSTASTGSTTSSAFTASTTADSLFSNQNSLSTKYTNTSTYEFPSPAIYTQPQPKPSSTSISTSTSAPRPLTLQEALPTRFDDMYAPELLADPSLLIEGRPMFTKRALLDWELNDIRSLLILEKLHPDWNNQLPVIYTPQGFKFEYLPLDADDSQIVKTLVESDLYKEANLDMAFRIQTAKYTLHAARSRHAQFLRSSGLPLIYNNRFSKPEWRNVIENFLLNLAVEAQCRHDFKKSCSELKRVKKQEAIKAGVNSGNSTTSNTNPTPTAPKLNGKNSLLRKAIFNDVTQSAKETSQPQQRSTKLTKEEKARLWTDVQEKVYRRIGLDWAPDKITG